MIRTACSVLAVLGLSACAMISESQCRSGGDWRAFGESDGFEGRAPEYLGEYAQVCAKYGAKPVPADYEAGRQAGLKGYCTPQNGFQRGAIGDAYLGVCPKEMEPQCVAELLRGRRLRPATPALYPYFAAVDQDERALAAAADDAERARLRARLVQTQWWIRFLMNRRGTRG